MDPFARHGIRHLSASSLNLYVSQPALWCGKYLLKWRDDVGPGAWRGNAVETGCDLAAYNRTAPMEAILAKAIERFEIDAQGDASDEVQKERDAIRLMLEQAVPFFAARPIPIGRQVKVEAWIDGVPVPVIGYLDYLYEDGLVDLKTTHRLPSEPTRSHVAQTAIYWKARKVRPTLFYATTQKKAPFELSDEQLAEGWSDMERAAKALMSMLRRAQSGRDALEMFAPDFSSFYWSDATKALAMGAYSQNAA